MHTMLLGGGGGAPLDNFHFEYRKGHGSTQIVGTVDVNTSGQRVVPYGQKDGQTRRS